MLTLAKPSEIATLYSLVLPYSSPVCPSPLKPRRSQENGKEQKTGNEEPGIHSQLSPSPCEAEKVAPFEAWVLCLPDERTGGGLCPSARFPAQVQGSQPQPRPSLAERLVFWGSLCSEKNKNKPPKGRNPPGILLTRLGGKNPGSVKTPSRRSRCLLQPRSYQVCLKTS